MTGMNRLDKTIFTAIFFSIFSAVMGVGIVVPLLPVYASDLGASGFYIGMIFAAFSLSRTFLLPLFGRLSDHTGRKPYITIGMLGYALVSVAFVFSDSVSSLILVRFIQGIASAMIMPVAQAYIGDITPKSKEGTTMGLFNLSMFGGLSIGPLAGGMLNDMMGMDAAFIGMGLLSLAGFFFSQFILPPTREEMVVRQRRAPVKWKRILRDRSLCGLLTLRFSYVFCIGTIWCFLPILASGYELSSFQIGILVMLGVLVSGLLQLPMGIMADHRNKRVMAVCGSLIITLAIGSYHWAAGFWSLFAINVVFGIGGGIAMPPLMAMAVIKGNEIHAMGSVMSLLTVAHSLGMLLGAAVTGVVMDVFTLRQAFPLAGILMLSGAVVFAICTYGQPDTEIKEKIF
ncbi:MAG: MFS transporter [Desulfosudaceae bacterium]